MTALNEGIPSGKTPQPEPKAVAGKGLADLIRIIGNSFNETLKKELEKNDTTNNE
jgi:hypothetical protein